MRGAAFQFDAVPILSRGRHRNPKRGACFMEFASYLAGERWSDHPACTHAVLAQLARQVNDSTRDNARAQLAPLIPSVIGLTSGDPRLDSRIALRAATAAVPVANEERQRTLAVALIAGLAADARSREAGSAPLLSDALVADIHLALSQAPGARDWAQRFTHELGLPDDERMPRRQCQAITTSAIDGLARACVADIDERLVRLLGTAIAEAQAFVAEEKQRLETPLTAHADAPRTRVRLTAEA